MSVPENYYLVAYDDFSKTCKHYRVDKMIKPQVMDECREGEERFKDFDMAAYSKTTFDMYGGEKKKVKIQFHNKMSGVFIDRFGKDITFRPVDEKHSELNVDVYVSPQFFGWIFGLGKDVKVVGPEEVVEQMERQGIFQDREEAPVTLAERFGSFILLLFLLIMGSTS